MKPHLFVPLTALLLCPLSAGAAQTAPAYPALPPVSTAAPAPPAAHAGAGNADHVQGRVTAVDTVKRTFTVQPRGAAAPITVLLAPEARVLVTGAGTTASLKVGDRVAAYGTATPDAPTLSSDRIVVLPAEPVRANGRAPKRAAGFHPKRVEGTITTLTPALTLTTPGNVVVTVTLAPTARVETLTTGSLTDVGVGETVEARVTGGMAAPTALEVRVLPARARGGRGKKRGAGLGAAIAPLPISTPAVP